MEAAGAEAGRAGAGWAGAGWRGSGAEERGEAEGDGDGDGAWRIGRRRAVVSDGASAGAACRPGVLPERSRAVVPVPFADGAAVPPGAVVPPGAA
ncbi:hypothetical protein [Streptomyces capoamus]|uniref:hypothetical protein n=1 Tax=Streptomyces capoamus TaxID=68183 RepID=UPI0033987AF6